MDEFGPAIPFCLLPSLEPRSPPRPPHEAITGPAPAPDQAGGAQNPLPIAVPLPLPLVPWDALVYARRALERGEEPSPQAAAASQQLLHALQRHGYACVSMPPGARTLVDEVAGLALAFFAQPARDKKCARHDDGPRFLGHSKQGAREWFQLRRFEGRVPFPHVPTAVPPMPAARLAAQRHALNAAAVVAETVAAAAAPPGSSSAGEPHRRQAANNEGSAEHAGATGPPTQSSSGQGPAAAAEVDGVQVQVQQQGGGRRDRFEPAFIELFELCHATALASLAGVAAALQLDYAWLSSLLDTGDLPWRPEDAAAGQQAACGSGSCTDERPGLDSMPPMPAAAGPTCAAQGHGTTHSAVAPGPVAGPTTAPEEAGDGGGSTAQQQAPAAPLPPAAPLAPAAPRLGSDVLRVYSYFRPPGSPLPGLRDSATGLHADMGLITVAPVSSLPGLMVLAPDATRFLDVERTCPREAFVVFAGDCG